MQFPWLPDLYRTLGQSPTVGLLMDLCEENYRYLLNMAPQLAHMQGASCSSLPGHMDLFMEILEQSRYTTTVHLTYFFHHHSGQVPDPDAVLRVYHDARQVEILSISAEALLPVERCFFAPGLQNKWNVNLFVMKWLAYCANQGHKFPFQRT